MIADTQSSAIPLPASPPRPHLTLRASRGWTALHLSDLWLYRDLLLTLASRDLKLRYKQTVLGVVWVILQPLLAAGIFSFVFNLVAKLPSDGKPVLVFSFAGLLGWTFFSNVLTKVSGCLVGNSHLISKVFFPRLILPLSNVASCVVDLGVSSAMMVLLMFIYHVVPSAALLLAPVCLLILTTIATGVGLWAAALMVPYRDIQYVLPVFMNLLLFASPVAYSLTAVPEWVRRVYLLNPLVPPLAGLRASILGTPFPSAGSLMVSALFGVMVLAASLYAFKRMERSFADVI